MAWDSTTVVRLRAERQMRRVKDNALEMFSPAMGVESVQEIIDQMPVGGEVLAYQQELTAKLNKVSGFNDLVQRAKTDPSAKARLDVTRANIAKTTEQQSHRASIDEKFHRAATDPLADLEHLRAVLDNAGIEQPQPKGDFMTLTEWHAAVMAEGHAALKAKYNPQPEIDFTNLVVLADHRPQGWQGPVNPLGRPDEEGLPERRFAAE